MRFSSIRYLLREGFRNVWHNRFMSVASVGVLLACLILTGFSYLVFVNVGHMFDTIYEQNVVVAYADPGTTPDQLKGMEDRLNAITNIQKVEFMSRDDILQKYKDSFSPELFEELQGADNPMQDAFVITLTDLAKFDATLWQIEQLEHVESVSSSGDIAETLTTVRNVVLLAGGWIIVLLLLVSLFIIANTIKLTVYARRLEIGIMKSVGATNAFIRTPFVVEGMVLGLLAGGLALGVTYFIYSRLEGMLSISAFTGLIPFTGLVWILAIGYLTAGLLTGVLGSAISISKYLKEEGRSAFE